MAVGPVPKYLPSKRRCVSRLHGCRGLVSCYKPRVAPACAFRGFSGGLCRCYKLSGEDRVDLGIVSPALAPAGHNVRTTVRVTVHMSGLGGPRWGIMRYMGLVEIAAILVFVALVAFAVWWVVTRLHG